MNMERKLFGTDGVRWIVDKESLDFVLRLAMAIGSYFPKGSRALVGMDGRLGNSAIYGTVLSALSASGSKVYDAGLLPTPALQYCVKEFGFDYGVMVTASHNPPEWVGIKLILSDGIEAPPNVDVEVESILFESKFRRVQWYEVRSIEKFEGAIGYYIDAIKKHVDVEKIRKKQIKVVVDCANSVSALTTPRTLKELGLKVLSINSDIGIPYRPYEPTPENLYELMSIVKAVGADFGVAHDGDGDRAVFIDNLGRFIPGDISAIILSWYVELKRPELPKRIVTAISTSHFLVEENLIKRGIEVVWTRVGFLNIARKIIELGGALSGFEDNGGFAYVPHQLIRDGTMTAALMAEYLASIDTSLASVVDSIKKPIVLREKLPIQSREEGKKIIEGIKEIYRGNRYIDIDGIKVISHNFAFLVRPSGTEPLIRITVESWDRNIAEKTLNELITYIKSIQGKNQ
ncbi:Phosphoglucosamine mutase [Ignisphaera aggregans DSM 17230]|uniref:Phosphoglucosamine mutase n=1 Tax=Ignisphaera aggregans (strain DSM 17230 / JCM 13409 / AQ1.S1) TaxID=583356 RepID=E0SPA8_IGNAA|nr:Phosphoglucosamine mutase [Ignisphaera aggregans DSM 17230]